ncbi:MAG: 5-bromo-4-chloroindolyl phosphate hydrolysis family protein [Schwartzia sp.]|nr:5-bromo-4-chloroindolyl phosphate hydrolysis family protein [Schwartzia sp. (in: firmicutes)]
MTALFVALMIFSVASGYAWWQASAPAWAVGSFLMALALGFGASRSDGKKKRNDMLRLAPPDDLPEGFLPESFEKAVANYNATQQVIPQIKDAEIAGIFKNMQRTARHMLGYLEKHPEKLPRARRFIDYYQEQAYSLLSRYREMEATGLRSAVFLEASGRLRAGLMELDGAYREQFAKLFDDDILNLDADLKVMHQMMEADGVKGVAYDVPGGQGDLGDFQRTATVGPQSVRNMPAPAPPAYEKERRLARRQKIIAGALGIFLGSFGAHKFYFGKTKWGFLYALLSWTGLPGFLGMIEGIRFLFMPMDDFYEQYYRGSSI